MLRASQHEYVQTERTDVEVEIREPARVVQRGKISNVYPHLHSPFIFRLTWVSRHCSEVLVAIAFASFMHDLSAEEH
jgi:hypothetical protein